MRWFVTIAAGLWIVLGLAACARAPASTPTATTLLRLTPEPSPTATQVATLAVFPTLTPHIFCENVQESILIVGERGRVTLTEDGRWLNLRAGPGTENDVIAQMAPLEDFLVLDGACLRRTLRLVSGIIAARSAGSPRAMRDSISPSLGCRGNT